MAFCAVAGAAVLRTGRPATAVLSEQHALRLEVEAVNEYGLQAGAAYPWLRGALLVEPSRATLLTVKNPLETADYEVSFAVTGPRPSTGVAHNSSGDARGAVTVALTAVGEYDLTVTATSAAGGSWRSYLVYCRYVRREIRGLTAEDRESFLAAAHVLWTTPSTEGRARYGRLYVGVDTLAEFHNTQAGAQDCDHIHDGLGFFTQHAALSMRFEQSVQLVDSRVALPYWDFTVEEAASRAKGVADANRVADVLTTELWTDEFFGAAGLGALAGAPVADGRWGYAPVRGDAWNTTHNAFGLLRAPWNNNPTPFVTRAATQCGADSSRSQPWPTCEAHLATLANASTFSEWAYALMLAPHGPLHVLVGGATGCDAEYDALRGLGVATRDIETLKMLSFALTKNLYRLGLRACPERCARRDDLETRRRLDAKGLYRDGAGARGAGSSQQNACRCGCPALEATARAARNGSAVAALYLGSKVVPDPALRKTLAAIARADDGLQRVASIAHVLCEADVLIGDQLESASPVDVSFWPIHPTLERLYHWKLLRWGGFDAVRWETDPRSTSVYGADCAGHRADDLVHLDLETLATEAAGPRVAHEAALTNAQLLDAFDPSQASLPFIYDAFDWAHCDQLGVHLGSDRDANPDGAR